MFALATNNNIAAGVLKSAFLRAVALDQRVDEKKAAMVANIRARVNTNSRTGNMPGEAAYDRPYVRVQNTRAAGGNSDMKYGVQLQLLAGCNHALSQGAAVQQSSPAPLYVRIVATRSSRLCYLPMYEAVVACW